MKDIIVDDFQNAVSESLVRHKSIVDIMTKLTESNARINRALAKSVTTCGCIDISAKKQQIPDDASLDSVFELFNNQIQGKLCDNCREVLEEEIGSELYYLAAFSNSLDLDLFDILIKQYNQIKTLGKFRML